MFQDVFGKSCKIKPSLTAMLLVSGVVLSGCTGGTTYGTGVGQEEQTLTDLTEMLTLQKKRKVIDYSPRPDLVVPEQKQLVAPVDAISTASNPDWPESPEQRVARIRAAADEAQATNASRIEFDKSKKKFLSSANKLDAGNEAPIGQGVPNYSCDPDGLVMRQCTSDEISRAVREERKLAKIGSGKQRRYLTDPPNKYLTPAETATIGDEGYTEEELEKLAALEKLRLAEEERRKRESVSGY